MHSAQETKQSIFEAVVTKLYVSNSSSAKYLIVAPEPHKDWWLGRHCTLLLCMPRPMFLICY